jgi:2-C-methyl-D-erythritol 2,4-cyclodiphosphate synthase
LIGNWDSHEQTEIKTAMRIGQGFDAHRLGEPGSTLSIRLGGMDIPFDREIIAHSDGDVLIHALCDALLGAIGQGDIGLHFPDSDLQYENADSLLLLKETMAIVFKHGFKPVNADLTLIAEEPKMGSYRHAVQAVLADAMGMEPGQVNVKATTTEGMGFIGRKEGLAASVVVMVETQ